MWWPRSAHPLTVPRSWARAIPRLPRERSLSGIVLSTVFRDITQLRSRRDTRSEQTTMAVLVVDRGLVAHLVGDARRLD